VSCISSDRSCIAHTFTPPPRRRETERALAHLEDVICLEGPSTIAAIVLESIPGTAGIMVPPPGYLAGVRELCDRYGIVFIADEVMAGFGRSGKWFAVDHFDVTPDLLTFAKGVNSGYVPLGGVAISPAIASTFADRPYPGGLTYSGHPLATATAAAAITVMREERIVENAACVDAEVSTPGCTNSPNDIRASARSGGSVCSGRSRWLRTRRRASPWHPTVGPAPR
jgi:taurine---2-oxoglutarate transaminase